MCSAVVVVGLALVLALQVAIHLRLARMPSLAAERIMFEVRSRARADADTLKEGTAKSVGEIVRSLNQHHDRIQRYQFDLAERHRAEIATLQARARDREAHANVFADLVAELRDITHELCAQRDDDDDEQRKTAEALPRATASALLRVPERRPPPVPRGAMPPPPPADELAADPDARQTVVSPPPGLMPPAADDEPEEEPTTVAPRSPARPLTAQASGRGEGQR